MSMWAAWLTWIEQSALGDTIRGAGVWAYGIVNLIHILGIATLFGSMVVLDLRLLGWRRNVSLDAITSITTPLAAIGFVIAALSGVCMLSVNGSEYIGNPFLPIKFIVIAFAFVNAFVLSHLSAWRNQYDANSAARVQLAIGGGLSLFLWSVAVSAGRMIGYW